MTVNLFNFGASNLRAKMAAHLNNVMPPLLAAARLQQDWEEYLLPDPKRYDAYDPLTADVFPIVGMYINRTAQWTRVDVNEAAEEVYEARFSCGVFIWVRTPEKENGEWEQPTYDSTIRLRDDMASILRIALLTTPSLGSQGAMAIDERTVSEDYPDAIKASEQNQRYMAGAVINCEVRVRETNYLPTLAVANTIVVEAEPIQEEAP